MATPAVNTFIGYGVSTELASIIGNVSTLPTASTLINLGVEPTVAEALGGVVPGGLNAAQKLALVDKLIQFGMVPEVATLIVS